MKYALKYRPKSFASFLGNEALLARLKKQITGKSPPQTWLISGYTGCVDAQTQYLSRGGWRFVDNYTPDTEIAQFHPHSEQMEFIKPLHYIVLPETHFYHIKTKTGLNQMLSPEHRMIVANTFDSEWEDITAKDFVKQHKQVKKGYSGHILTTFGYQPEKTYDVSDKMLELFTTIMIKGFLLENTGYVYGLSEGEAGYLHHLLNELGLPYTRSISENSYYVGFDTIPGLEAKTACFESDFHWSRQQIQIVVDTFIKWMKNNTVYVGKQKHADFLQMCLTMWEITATISKGDKPDNFQVKINNVGSVPLQTGNKKTKIKTKKSKDGKKYCFEVPSGYLVLRRKGCIFITGNSGKTTLSRIMARSLLELDPKEKLLDCVDYDEINIGTDRSIDKMREIATSFKFKPRYAPKKVYVFDEAHKLLDASASAMLVPAEQPPPHVFMIFATNEPQKLLKPLRDRASHIHLEPLTAENTKALLVRVAEKEQLQFVSDKVAEKLAEHYQGETRQALDALQALASQYSDQKSVKLSDIQKALVDNLEFDTKSALLLLSALYTGQLDVACGQSQQFHDPRTMLRNLLDLNNYLLCKMTGVSNWPTTERKQLITNLKTNPPNIELVLRTQKLLFEAWKTFTTESGCDPKQIMLVIAATLSLATQKGSK